MSNTENTTTEGFVKRIMASLKGGDEGKLKRFHAKAIKHLNDQIRIRQTEIEELHEKGVDLQEEYAEAVLSVDFDSISTTVLPSQILRLVSSPAPPADLAPTGAPYRGRCRRHCPG